MADEISTMVRRRFEAILEKMPEGYRLDGREKKAFGDALDLIERGDFYGAFQALDPLERDWQGTDLFTTYPRDKMMSLADVRERFAKLKTKVS